MPLLRSKETRENHVLLFQFFEGLRICLPGSLFVLRRRVFPILLTLKEGPVVHR
jgi:hypothetical protein